MFSKLNQKIVGSIYVMEKIREDVVLIEMTSKETMTLDILKSLMKDIHILTDNKPYHSFTNITTSSSEMTNDAKEYMKVLHKEETLNLSQVFIFESLSKAFLVGIYLSVMKQKLPTKCVTSIAKGYEWVDSLNSTKKSLSA